MGTLSFSYEAFIERSLHQPHQQILALDAFADLDADFADGAGTGGGDGGEHLHGFEGGDGVAFFDLLTDADGDAGDHAGHGGTDLSRIVMILLGFVDGELREGLVGDRREARVAV